jgi:tetratricopeptide (TPR) repeat protein/tRNA A-37 threonylcarbamoyl transferase component Bud32
MASSTADTVVERQLREACAELGRRVRAGEDCGAESFLADYPEVASHADSALELIYTEFVIREQLGQHPSPEQWYSRFPRWQQDLQQIFQVHRFVCPDIRTGVDIVSRTPLPDLPTADWPAGPDSNPDVRPRHFGSYELIEEISRGGMGVVYKARQRGLNRIVALKMILAGEFASSEELARFRREAEAAAALQHPNIVQIYEVGVHEDRPFFSLEYVDGGNLGQRLAKAPLPARQAAQLVETLARAVHYAHERGIIHRDIKPANVLLTSDGTPKITDFGLAKQLMDPAGEQTKSGAVLGTPSYMAPEQAEGKSERIGPAVDIYALGAILYEVLTGRPPFRASTPLETLDQVRLQEPVPPRKLQPKNPADLENICLKCLQKEPGRRYASALDLADDLRRFLAGEPIQARPVGSWERTTKWVRRRPVVAALLLAVVLISTSGVAGIVWQWRQAVQGRQDALDALDQMTIARQAEETQRQRARRAVDKMFTQVAEKWLAQQPRLEPLQKQFLEDALHFYEEFAQERSTEPELRLETGKAYRRAGEIQQKLGELANAEEALDRAIALLKELLKDFPNESRYRAALAAAQHNLGGLLRKLGRLDECEKELRESSLLREKLVAECPDVVDHVQDLALSRFALASAQAGLGRHRAAEDGFNQALAILQKLPADLRNKPECRVCEASCHQHIGSVQDCYGRWRESVESRKLAVAIFEQLVRDYPSEPGYRDQLALALMWFGAHPREAPPKEGEAALRRALAIGEKLVVDFPSVPDYRVHVAIFRKYLAVSLNRAGRAEEAKQTFGEVFDLYKKLAAEVPAAYDYAWELTDINLTLRDMLMESGRFQEAEKACRESLVIARKLAADAPSVPGYRDRVAFGNHRLGEVLGEARRSQEAEKAYRQAIATWSDLVKEYPTVEGYSLWLALCYGNLAELFTVYPDEKYRNANEALKLAKRAVELRPDISQGWNALGIAHYRMGEWKAAVTALEKSVELGKGGYWFDWFFLAMANWRLDRKEEARRWYDQGVAWMEKNKAELASNMPRHAQCCRYRAEAAAVLGVKQP